MVHAQKEYKQVRNVWADGYTLITLTGSLHFACVTLHPINGTVLSMKMDLWWV